MRVLTLNIASCRAGVDRVAGLLRTIDPDVAMLTEVARGQERALAQALGERVAVKGSTLRVRGYGNAILLHEPPRDVRRIRFPRMRPFERRGMVFATLRSGVTVAATHLGLGGVQRLHNAGLVIRALGERDPVILAGDLNEEPGGPAIALLLERYVDAFAVAGEGTGETFPSDAPLRRIDYVLCSSSLTPVKAAVVPIVASDHLGVVADIS